MSSPSPFEKAILYRLKPYCIDCEKYLNYNNFDFVIYEDRFEIFCAKHGNLIPADKIKNNCLAIVVRIPAFYRESIDSYFTKKLTF
jgi:hypothetical protein